ncbi:hypothetical protein GGR64_003470 [Xanthomonas arboricola]|nr:hypothetical protein [Xanthomonas sp. 3307]
MSRESGMGNGEWKKPGFLAFPAIPDCNELTNAVMRRAAALPLFRFPIPHSPLPAPKP